MRIFLTLVALTIVVLAAPAWFTFCTLLAGGLVFAYRIPNGAPPELQSELEYRRERIMELGR